MGPVGMLSAMESIARLTTHPLSFKLQSSTFTIDIILRRGKFGRRLSLKVRICSIAHQGSAEEDLRRLCWEKTLLVRDLPSINIRKKWTPRNWCTDVYKPDGHPSRPKVNNDRTSPTYPNLEVLCVDNAKIDLITSAYVTISFYYHSYRLSVI